MSAESLLDVVENIYASASEPARWDATLVSIRNLIRADSYAQYVYDLDAPERTFSRTDLLTSGELQRYNRCYAAENDWNAQLPHQPVGRMNINGELVGMDVYRSSRLYQEMLGPLGVEYGVGGAFSRDDRRLGCMNFHRGAKSKPFGAAEVHFLEQVSPHMARASFIQDQLTSHRIVARSGLDALDRMALAMMLLDNRGRIVACNQQAEELFRQRIFCRENGELQLYNASGAGRFRTIMREVLKGGGGKRLFPAGAVRVAPFGEGSTTYEILALPFVPSVQQVGLLLEPVAAVVFVKQVDDSPLPHLQLLRQLYGLTATEAKVCSQLVEGFSLAEIADRMDVTREAVRYHCKNLLRKTGVRRQAELIKSVCSGVAPLARVARFDGEPLP